MDAIGSIPQYPQLIYPPDQIPNRSAKTGGTSIISQTEKMSIFESKETGVAIVTKEGDYVTISADSEFQLDVATYDQTGRMRGVTSSLHFQALSFDSSQEFSINVDGDLNEQEMKDIQKVLHSLDKIMNDLLSGRLDQGMTRAGKLANMGSLSSIDATLQGEQNISVEKAVKTETISSPTTSTNQATAIQKPIDPNALDVAQSKMMDTLHRQDFSSDTMARIIEKFFSKLSEGESKNGHWNFQGNGLIDQLRNLLLNAISNKH